MENSSTPLTRVQKRKKRAKRLAAAAAALILGQASGLITDHQEEIVKATILRATMWADPDDAEAVEAWVDRTSAALTPFEEWTASDWAASTRQQLDTSVAAKREQEQRKTSNEASSLPTQDPEPSPDAVPTQDPVPVPQYTLHEVPPNEANLGQ